MSGLHLSWMDLIVIGVVIVSTIFAIYRGFVRETLTIFAWAAAAFASLYFGHYAVGIMQDHFSPLVARIAAYSLVFVLVLLPLSFISYRLSQGVQDSAVGTLDRSLGAVFGILRGLAIVALAYIVFSLAVPVRAQPRWMSRAELLPLVQSSADILLSIVPTKKAPLTEEHGGARVAEDQGETSQAEEPAAKNLVKTKKHARKGYGADDRRALDRLFEATNGNEAKQQ